MKAVLAHARLLLDVVSIKIFVWMFGHDGELLDSHLFFFDRYSDLADYHRQQGRIAKADRLAAIAEAYFQAAPDDDEPPEAAAMAMRVPRSMTRTNAGGRPCEEAVEKAIERTVTPGALAHRLARDEGGLGIHRSRSRRP
jgi:hypothetical protein